MSEKQKNPTESQSVEEVQVVAVSSDVDIELVGKLLDIDEVSAEENSISPTEEASFDCSDRLVEIFRNCQDVSQDTENFKSNIIEVIVELNETDQRLLYSDITSYVYSQQNNHGLVTELGIKIDIIKEMITESPNESKVLAKIFDHVSLAQNQGHWVATKQQQEDLADLILKSQFQLAALEEEIKKPATDLVSILGIFTGIAFITFGGISMADNLMNLVGQGVSMRKSVIGIILIGFVLMNALVVCMQYIRSITDQDIRALEVFWNHDKEWYLKPGMLMWINAAIAIVSIIIYYVLPGR